MIVPLAVDYDRLSAALQTTRTDLLDGMTSDSHWVGQLSSSPLATATAVSALALAEQHIDDDAHVGGATDSTWLSGVMVRNELNELLIQSLRWIASQQNEDGGWGDTDRSKSNIATTMLVEAAFHLTGVPAQFTGMLERAHAYVEAQGGVNGLRRRYGNDKTFAAPILTNYALAGMIPWSKIPALPFELACFPQSWYRRLQLPVVSYAIPALAAIGLARHVHAPSINPVLRGVRSLSRKRVLQVVEAMQPESGGFLEATPLTSFVVMSLACIGEADQPVVRRGVEFLLTSVRGDGSWAIDTDLSAWNTSQAALALDWQFTDEASADQPSERAMATLDWLLSVQTVERHPYTDAAPGGWPWTDHSGGVPDADDTSAALLALASWHRRWPSVRRKDIRAAAGRGLQWLLDLQNSDGGIPTFCRGWGKLPFDRSSTDITAHAVRAWTAWRDLGNSSRKIDAAVDRAMTYLVQAQGSQGAWSPLWFGNQHHHLEQNLVYGTAKVLIMYDQIGRMSAVEARRGADWLVSVQQAGGGWGPAPCPPQGNSFRRRETNNPPPASVEETALAVEALLPLASSAPEISSSVAAGVDWLVDHVEKGCYVEPAPIGFYFAKLWYYERLYPQVFAVSALAKACRTAGIRLRPATASA